MSEIYKISLSKEGLNPQVSLSHVVFIQNLTSREALGV